MKFELRAAENGARTGVVETEHGDFETPAFMPVGTQGSVKAMEQRELVEIGAQIILANTYHLYLRPGIEILRDAGGLHRFIGWERPVLTDSGGYQVFSLADLRKIVDDGVEFKSHLDGSTHFFSPEKVIDVQRVIGSDIMMVLDECPPYPCSRKYAEESNALTLRWAERCKKYAAETEPLHGYQQYLFCIVQGSVFRDLRTVSANALVGMEFDGYAIGGLAVGEPTDQMYDMISLCTDILPSGKPRYLMGVGTPENLLEAISRGVDMFDCVLPTRNGRNAMLFTGSGPITITNARHKNDFSPVDPECDCYCCRSFSRAYLRHLFQVKEILGLQMATLHNLRFFQRIMIKAREEIKRGGFESWKKEFIASLRQEETTLLTTS